jgi:hypothetical protein
MAQDEENVPDAAWPIQFDKIGSLSSFYMHNPANPVRHSLFRQDQIHDDYSYRQLYRWDAQKEVGLYLLFGFLISGRILPQ